MTFRSRVITATVAAAAITVVLACLSSFVTSRNALLHSVDESLLQQVHHVGPRGSEEEGSAFTGSYVEIVLANGTAIPQSSVPIDKVLLSVAKAKSPQVLRTVHFNGQYFRELIVPLPAGYVINAPQGEFEVNTTSAQLFVVNVTGQITELKNLVRNLLIIAALGLGLALALGLFLARQALHPLEEVTNEIEVVSNTSNMSYRFVEGDSDELGRLRRVFNRLLATVEDSQQLQRQLVMDASHELRTPLTSLRTNAQVLSKAAQLSPDDLSQITTDVVAQVDELSALVTDLGELARGERSEGEVVELRVDEVVLDCVDTARTYARIKDITINATADSTTIFGRRDRLVRAVSNLLTNAVKFTPNGGTIAVEVSGRMIRVSDSGPGVAPSERALVFDRFWRSASARSLPGSGLGLSIVAQVVSELGATVTVDEDPVLHGARFTIALPPSAANH